MGVDGCFYSGVRGLRIQWTFTNINDGSFRASRGGFMSNSLAEKRIATYFAAISESRLRVIKRGGQVCGLSLTIFGWVAGVIRKVCGGRKKGRKRRA